MSKASIAIGVDRTGSLIPLQGAAAGASRFHEWAQSQGFYSVLLTDQNGETVTAASIFNAVKAIVDAMTYEQLIIFFAGHGQLTAPNCEFWLLSGAPYNPNEAVNLAGSIYLARYSGLKHVVFISDACRSIPDNARGRVTGQVIFPSTPHLRSAELDSVYATRPGDPALEARVEDAVRDYRGLLTECLLEGLSGRDQSVVQQFKTLPGAPWVVPTRPLRSYLEREVPAAATAIGIQYRQYPDIIVESAEPHFLAKVAGPPPGPPTSLPPVIRASSEQALPRFIEALLSPVESPAMELAGEDRSMLQKLGIEAAIDKILSTRSSVSGKIRTGFTFNGGRVARALSLDYGHWIEPERPDFFTENNALQFRTNDEYPNRARSLLVEFEEGTGACLGIFPNYVGSVLVENGRVTNVNYIPARDSSAYEDYAEASGEIEKRRAVIAAAARHGYFTVKPGFEGMMASYLRRFKEWDPTLGVYAAYAAMQKGDVKTALYIFHFMRRDSFRFGGRNKNGAFDDTYGLIPFDVALLAGRLEPFQEWYQYCAPACPMLTQGWAYLDRYDDLIPAEILEARGELIPGLWTTFTPAGVKILEKAMMKKRIR